MPPGIRVTDRRGADTPASPPDGDSPQDETTYHCGCGYVFEAAGQYNGRLSVLRRRPGLVGPTPRRPDGRVIRRARPARALSGKVGRSR